MVIQLDPRPYRYRRYRSHRSREAAAMTCNRCGRSVAPGIRSARPCHAGLLMYLRRIALQTQSGPLLWVGAARERASRKDRSENGSAALGVARLVMAKEIGAGAHTRRNRSSVGSSAGPAARILSPSPYATNGAIRATRRGAWVTGFDCGPVATATGLPHRGWSAVSTGRGSLLRRRIPLLAGQMVTVQ